MESWREELYLAHHGILGQKHGVRNGPPYPLDASDHSASEKKAGWRKSISKEDKVKARSEKKKAKDDEKVSKYKEKEQRLLDRQYDRAITSYKSIADKKLDKYAKELQKDSPNKKKCEKIMKSYTKSMTAHYYQQGLKLAEKHKVNSATIEDVKKEKIALGKAAAQAFFMSAGSAMLAYTTPMPVWFVKVPDSASVKRNTRLSKEQQKTIAEVSSLKGARAAYEAQNRLNKKG